jgi:16S rRNA (uracil1498-N3)-methyltransferase
MMSVPRFYAPDARDGVAQIALPDDEARHLRLVLRGRAGAVVRVFDGAGSEWEAVVTSTSSKATLVSLEQRVATVREPEVRVTLGVGILKGDQMDAVVRDATALGVAAIVPLATAHVTVPPRAWQTGGAMARWERIAVASVKQCGRAVVPAIAAVARLEDAIASAAAERIVMAVEPARAEPTAPGTPLPRPRNALLLIGPEGGWASHEIDSAASRGARLVHLGPRTLRAEIAPTVLLSALWTQWGW